MTKTKIILFIAISAYAFYFSFLTVTRHHALLSGRYDLGNMEQTVWNTSEGRIFQMTNPDTSNISSRLAFHADFLLILVAPIYKLFPHTETLLIIQAFVVAIGAIPVFLIAKYILSPTVGARPASQQGGRVLPLQLLFSIFYLLSPVIQRANIYEFHSEVLAVTFLLFTFLFLITKKRKLFLLFFFLSFIGKETVSLNLIMICLFGVATNKYRRLCFLLMISSFIYFLSMVRIFIPAANETLTRHFALRHFGEADETFRQIITGYLKNPIAVFISLARTDSLVYYNKIFSFGGTIALFSPLTLLFSLPTLLINVLARDSQFQSLDFQYASTIIPGLIISMIYGAKTIMRSVENLQKGAQKQILQGFVTILFLLNIIFIFYHLRQYSPLPFIGKKPYLDFLTYKNPAVEKVRYWKTRIPSDKSVSATNNLGSQFAKRQNLYAFPMKATTADYVVIAAKSWQDGISSRERDKIILELKENPRYQLLDESQYFWIFKKK